MMSTDEKLPDLVEMVAKRHSEADKRKLHELQIISAELKSLHKGSHVYSRIANGNVFLMTTHDKASTHNEQELKSLSHVKLLNQQTQPL